MLHIVPSSCQYPDFSSLGTHILVLYGCMQLHSALNYCSMGYYREQQAAQMVQEEETKVRMQSWLLHPAAKITAQILASIFLTDARTLANKTRSYN